MSEQRFDVFTREAAEALSRRRSLLALGGAGAALAALTQSQIIVVARRGRKKRGKGKKRDPNKKCKKQVNPCETFIRNLCAVNSNGNEELEEACLEQYLLCCPFFATCNARNAVTCLTEPLNVPSE